MSITSLKEKMAKHLIGRYLDNPIMKKTNRNPILLILLFTGMLPGCFLMPGCSGFPGGARKFREPQPVISRSDNPHTIESMNISSDGSLLAVGYSPVILGSSERRRLDLPHENSMFESQPILRIWSLEDETPQLLGTRPINNLKVRTPAFSRDDKSLFIAEQDGVLRIYLDEVHQWKKTVGNVNDPIEANVIPDSTTEKIYDGQEPIQLLSKHGGYATFASSDGKWSLLNVRSKTVRYHLFGDIDRVLAFSSSGQFIAVREKNPSESPRGNERIAVWSIPSRRSQDSVTKVTEINIEHFASEELCRFSPDETLLAMVLRPGTLGLWNVRSGKLVGELEHENSIRGFAFSPTEKRIIVATSGQNAQLTLWDTNKNNVVQTQHDRSTDEITAVVFDPDGKSYFTGDKSGNIKRWLVKNKK